MFPTHRLTTNRSNPYLAPGRALKVGIGARSRSPSTPARGRRGVVANLIGSGRRWDRRGPIFTTGSRHRSTRNDLFNRIKQFAFSDSRPALPAPLRRHAPTRARSPRSARSREMTDYLHVYSNP